MLNGIEVLNESYVPMEFPADLFFGFLICLVLAILSFAIFIECIKNDDCRLFSIGISALFTVIFTIIFIKCFNVGLRIQDTPSYIKQYQVTISDNVSMVEFNERYDVISVQGKIYTIVEKEK